MNDPEVLARLATAPFEVLGRFLDASNATLLVRLRDTEGVEDREGPADLDPRDTVAAADLAVHKPAAGERPLWDFPEGTLHRREVAAYEVSRALGVDLVPETVLRPDGPFGPGSLQRFVAHDPSEHYFTLLARDDTGLRRRLMDLVVLDLVLDNADRKSGHVLLAVGDGTPDARVVAVDHGVTFNVEPKLRTVAWDLAGATVPVEVRAALERLGVALEGELGARLGELLAAEEVRVLGERVARTAALDVLPGPTGPRPYPWPLV